MRLKLGVIIMGLGMTAFVSSVLAWSIEGIVAIPMSVGVGMSIGGTMLYLEEL